ncbi:MAG: GTP-dependent dephospho-CoA kinase family protein [Thermoplasmatota archaeon]
MNTSIIPDHDLKLPEDNREELKQTLGPVVSGELPEKYINRTPIIAVGDVVSDILIEQGVTPDVCIYDGITRRGDYESKQDRPEKTLNIKNPAGMIKQGAWEVIQEAINIKEPVSIEVDGEEDLLSLVSIALCPEGGIVIYGIPSKGMVINEVDSEIKPKALEVINKMIKVDEG